jgi:hypothetical protein
MDKGSCVPCFGDDSAKPVLVSCPETSNWRNEFLNKEWLDMNEDAVCTNTAHVCSLDSSLEQVKKRVKSRKRNLDRNAKSSWGHAVAHLVDALHCTTRFDSRWCHWNFSLT